MSEVRPIDANEALEIIDNYIKSMSITAKTEPVVSAIKDIVRFISPSLDYEPVVHAHWIKRYKSKYYKCSICGGIVEDEWHNCPHCRAKMDEEVKE